MGRAEVLAVIAARSGSRGVPHKNIRQFCGKPLFTHSIAHAKDAKLVTRIAVSTDSAPYRDIAVEYGAEAPFLRPPELARDSATDLEVFTHALGWLQQKEGYRPQICVHLRPTCPIRNSRDIDRAIQFLLERPELDSVRSVIAAPATPFKTWFRDDDGCLRPVVQNPPIPEAWNLPRQVLPPTYLQNASIDAVRSSVILEKRSMTGTRIFGLLMTEGYDIDSEADFRRVEEAARAAEAQSDNAHTGTAESRRDSGQKTFVFDIDGVIATVVPGNDYARAGPIEENVAAINRLFNVGHRIVLFTARGYVTGKDWRDLTERQLKDWGVRYDQLVFGKPAGDFYIDDRSVPLRELATLVEKYER